MNPLEQLRETWRRDQVFDFVQCQRFWKWVAGMGLFDVTQRVGVDHLFFLHKLEERFHRRYFSRSCGCCISPIVKLF